MRTLIQNLGYALCQLRKTTGFTSTVLLTLALGIGDDHGAAQRSAGVDMFPEPGQAGPIN